MPGPARPGGGGDVPRQLTAGAIEAGGVTDVYEAAGIGRPDLSHLDEAFIERMQRNRNPHLAIEALRRLIEQEMRKVTRHNIVRQQSFSDRLVELMPATPTSTSPPRRSSPNWSRWPRKSPRTRTAASNSAPRSPATNSPSTTRSRRTSRPSPRWARRARRHRPRSGQVPAARRHHRLGLPRRRPRQAPSTIKRLLASYGYPPDAEPGATELVIRQMETFAEEWSPNVEW